MKLSLAIGTVTRFQTIGIVCQDRYYATQHTVWMWMCESAFALAQTEWAS